MSGRLQKTFGLLAVTAASCLTANAAVEFDFVIRNGTIYDDSGGKPFNLDGPQKFFRETR